MTRYLDLHTYLRIAAEITGVEAGVLAVCSDLTAADAALNACAAHYGLTDIHPSFPKKAAVLARRLCTGKPLPSHNLPVAYETVREFASRNGYTWSDPPGDREGYDTAKMFRGVRDGTISDEQLAAWISERIGEITLRPRMVNRSSPSTPVWNIRRPRSRGSIWRAP